MAYMRSNGEPDAGWIEELLKTFGSWRIPWQLAGVQRKSLCLNREAEGVGDNFHGQPMQSYGHEALYVRNVPMSQAWYISETHESGPSSQLAADAPAKSSNPDPLAANAGDAAPEAEIRGNSESSSQEAHAGPSSTVPQKRHCSTSSDASEISLPSRSYQPAKSRPRKHFKVDHQGTLPDSDLDSELPPAPSSFSSRDEDGDTPMRLSIPPPGPRLSESVLLRPEPFAWDAERSRRISSINSHDSMPVSPLSSPLPTLTPAMTPMASSATPALPSRATSHESSPRRSLSAATTAVPSPRTTAVPPQLAVPAPASQPPPPPRLVVTIPPDWPMSKSPPGSPRGGWPINSLPDMSARRQTCPPTPPWHPYPTPWTGHREPGAPPAEIEGILKDPWDPFPEAQVETPVALAKVMKGKIGFIGAYKGIDDYDEMVLAMCGIGPRALFHLHA